MHLGTTKSFSLKNFCIFFCLLLLFNFSSCGCIDCDSEEISKIEELLESARQSFINLSTRDVAKKSNIAIGMLKFGFLNGKIKQNEFIPLYMNAMTLKNSIKQIPARGKNTITCQDSVNILVLDSAKKKVLLQKRGAFKRIFSDKLTVTANVKNKFSKMNDSDISKVNNEIGISISPQRLFNIRESNNCIRCMSYVFISFSRAERGKLFKKYKELKGRPNHNSIILDWNKSQASLSISYLGPNDTLVKKIETIANDIHNSTGIPYLYHMNSLKRIKSLIYILSAQEERKIQNLICKQEREKAAYPRLLNEGRFEEMYLALNSDILAFKEISKLQQEYRDNKAKYAVDVMEPSFGDFYLWDNIKPFIVRVNSNNTSDIRTAGGKGANLSILNSQVCKKEIPLLKIPSTSILTTSAYDFFVLENPNIRNDIVELDSTTDDEKILTLAKNIRSKIKRIDFSSDFKEKINQEFELLGKDIAIRSSSTKEDLKEFSAAGLAESYLHVTNLEKVCELIKSVWASTFSNGFIRMRILKGFKHMDAKMAVVLQRYVKAKSAGVAFSIDHNQRPAYVIQAQPGIGEGVVQGIGSSDEWYVGFMADTILEKNIKIKKSRIAAIGNGEVKLEKIKAESACIDDKKILDLAELMKSILWFYRSRDLAKEIDVEFVINNDNDIYIVQVRPKIVCQKDNGGGIFFRYRW